MSHNWDGIRDRFENSIEYSCLVGNAFKVNILGIIVIEK